MKNRLIFFFLLMAFTSLKADFYKIIESNLDHIKLEINFNGLYSIKEKKIAGINYSYITGTGVNYRKAGEPFLPSESFNIGIPYNKIIKIKVSSLTQIKNNNILIMPVPDSLNQAFDKLRFNSLIYNSSNYFPTNLYNSNESIIRYLKTLAVELSPYQYNPVSRELVFNKSFILDIIFSVDNDNPTLIQKVNDPFSYDFAESLVINSNVAKEFIGKSLIQNDIITSDSIWYNPLKDYYKVYIKEKKLYRITYEQLISSGVPENNGIHQGKLELINFGKRIPLEIVDNNNDGFFNSGDYFQFIGTPPPPADQYTYFNIYNISNVYWFSYQADSVLSYKSIDGFPTNFDNQILSTQETIHYEKDSLYERLGYAPNDKRDFWLWNSAEARHFQEYSIFTYWMTDSIIYRIDPNRPQVNIKTALQGITESNCSSNNGHSAKIKFNTNIIAQKKWNGQESVVLNSDFTLDLNGGTGIPLYSNNKFEFSLDGDVCGTSGEDLARINWFEFTYWRYNVVRGNTYIFNNPSDRIGKNTYFIYRWFNDTMKIYIPQRSEFIKNPKVNHDNDLSVQFTDSISEKTEYYCFGNNVYSFVDSIVKDVPSNLRANNQGVDYLIITHPLFRSVAQRLTDYRINHLNGIENPRIKIVDIYDIYDEYSFGLLSPIAVKKFISDIFTNWQSPSVSYVTLLGDMSYDYRPIYVSNRKNFIPSIPYQSLEFGQSPSDNLFVDVTGEDLIPDIAIGRISCETVDEGNILIDKIINYPADNGKEWKQNVLLMASGIDAADELSFGFNDESIILENSYLTPNGIHSSKVFRFPNKPEHIPFQGGGPKIREEINKGAVVGNYYGHGGGGQWDLTFTNDDIFQLNNEGRLPFIISVTCYTAHFDNQTIFGEIFNRIPNKGSIAFFGSSGLTWWQAGISINGLLFDEIFNKKHYTIGKAILNSKARSNQNAYIISQIALLHLLGDPALELALPKKPDFVVKSSDITFLPQNPIKGDTVLFKIKVRNLGINFQDSVTISLYHTGIDTSTRIGTIKIRGFGESDSVSFKWIPKKASLYNIILTVNEEGFIDEDDHSDNKAISNIAVFDFSEPNIVKPLNSSLLSKSPVKFTLVDIGDYINRKFNYLIELDTSSNLSSSTLLKSPILSAESGIVNWNSPSLPDGQYYWRAVIFDNIDTNRSKIKSFEISSGNRTNYSVKGKQLAFLESNNMVYNYSSNSLKLNTELLMPKPTNNQLIDSLIIKLPSDTLGMTTFTTDGSFVYYAQLPFYIHNLPTEIYKVGTGLHGTQRWKIYGVYPNKLDIRHSMFYYPDGNIYAATTDSFSLLKMNISTGDTSRIQIGDTLLLSRNGLLGSSDGYYLGTDGNYVYNLSAGYGNYYRKYVLRTFDPHNNWNKVGEDIILDGISEVGFSGFFVLDGYLYTYESYNLGYMRRYKISNHSFEEEWVVFNPFGIYTFCFDWINNNVLASTFRPGTIYTPSIYRFKGTYKDAAGSVFSSDIGPAMKWKNISYSIDTIGSFGHYKSDLLGLNKYTSVWDTIKYNIPPTTQLNDVDPVKYEYLKLNINFVDSSYGSTEPLKLKSMTADFNSLPELSIHENNITFTPDTLMQGFNTEVTVKVYNLGESDADSVLLKYTVNNSDSAFMTNRVSIPKDSSVVVKNTINTSTWAPATLYNTKILATASFDEEYSFNNQSEKSFYVFRDSLNPLIKITFDGKEINSGDIISARPQIIISLNDNSPLPLDTTMFTLVFDNVQMNFKRNDMKITFTQYPNNQLNIEWTPILKDGKHILEILARDASGNFFDSVTHRIEFFVYNETDLKNVFNYPNPFKNDTYFTFELLGQNVPEEFNIKIFTVAGRLIRDLSITSSNLKVGFNKIYWDGRDQDGDDVANGLYFYKIISKNNGIIKTSIQKLAKVK